MPKAGPGPGPANYKLPPTIGFKDHAVNKWRAPYYSMGLKNEMKFKTIGPGTKYALANMTRFGKVSPPAYTLHIKPELKANTLPVGPANYLPNPNPKRIPPKYSMRHRTQGAKLPNYPGPKYNIPSCLGPKVPDKHANGAYSMIARRDVKSQSLSPGPARYGDIDINTYKPRKPKYSLGQTARKINKEIGPGPAAYPAWHPKNCMGGYTFGLKTDRTPYITANDEMPCIEY